MSDAIEKLLTDEILKGSSAPLQTFVNDRSKAAPWTAAAQGLTFGGADEAEAWARSTFGGEDYESALADVRNRLAEYRKAHPGEAIITEMGGAALPAILGSLFTGGGAAAAQSARLFPTLAKVGGAGAFGGGLYGFNTGEGSGRERAKRIIPGAAGGVAGSVVGYTAGKGIVGSFAKLMDYTRRKFGNRATGVVERELMRAMRDSGINSIDEAADMLARGEILTDNKTMATIARGWGAVSAQADDTLRGVYQSKPLAPGQFGPPVPSRQARLRGDLASQINQGLNRGNDANALRTFNMGEEAARAAKSRDYNAAFAQVGDIGDDATAQLAESVRRVPGAQSTLNKLYRAKTGKQPFFSFDADGNVSFSRNPSLEEAEIVRRALRDTASKEFSAGSGAVGGAIKDIDSGVKSTLDEISPDLKRVRSEWSGIERAREAFEEGRKALSRSPDQVSLDFEKFADKPELLKAYRAGVMDAFRRTSFTGSGKSLPGRIVDPERKENAILSTVFPGDELDAMMNQAGMAARAQEASNTILGGSPTAITQGRIAEQGGPGILETALDAAQGGGGSVIRLASQMVKSAAPKLSSKDAAALAKLAVESNPNVFRRAMTDSTVINQATAVVTDLVRNIGNKGYLAGAGAGGASYATVPGLLGIE